MMDRIDRYSQEIRRPAVRNFNKWTGLLGNYTWPNADGYQSRTTHTAEVLWMKNWLTSRLTWIDSQHSKPPVFDQAGGPINAGTMLAITNPNPGGGQIYYTTDGSDPRMLGGAIAPAAQLYGGSILLEGAQTIRARVRTGAAWSPVQTEPYLVDGVAADATNLAVAEFDYRPAAPSPTEESRGFDVRTDFEFVEIMNVGPVAIDLAGVRFTGGIEFDFAIGEVRWLAPGERAVVVSNRDAFEMRYGAPLSALRIVGEFRNNLSNDGETIVLVDAAGAEIRNFTYNDKNPWPEAADGSGASLVLINPLRNPDHNNPLNWRSSLAANANPGGSDGAQFAGDPDGDDDQNGIGNFLQYALAPSGIPPVLPSTAIHPFTVEDVTSDFMTLTFTRNAAADDVDLRAQVSEDLVTWTGDSEGVFTVVSRVENANGTETITYRLNEPVSANETLFGRLLVEGRTP
jgi:hypothetical protein